MGGEKRRSGMGGEKRRSRVGGEKGRSGVGGEKRGMEVGRGGSEGKGAVDSVHIEGLNHL